MLNVRSAWHSTIIATAVSAFAGPALCEMPKLLSAAAPSDHVAFSLYFPVRDAPGLASLIEEQNRRGGPLYHRWLSPAQFAQRFGPMQTTIASATGELADRGLAVVQHQGQMLRVAGTIAAVQSALGIRLSHARFADGSEALVADRAPAMPPALKASGALTPDFTTVAPFHTDSRIIGPAPQNFQSPTGPYLAADLRQAYDFPSAQSLTAKGVTIAILIAGGFNPSDMSTYFSDDGLPSSLQPSITTIPINGGLAYNASTSGETHLDLQQSGATSLGATIGLYNLSDLKNATVLFGLNTIVSDNIADVVSMSFGEPEVDYLAANNGGTSQTYLVQIEDTLFQQGVSQGMTFVASSGDHGAIPPAGSSGKPTLSVDEPASDPFVVAVGGTNLVTTYVSGSDNSAYVSENANHDTEPKGEVWGSGGGISIFWGKPSYQSDVPTQSSKYRTVPDVAQHMGGCPSDAVKCNTPDSNDYEVIGGKAVEVIGTSASAPDIAGVLALKVAYTGGRLGWENVDIYSLAKQQNGGKGTPFHHKGIPGNNGHYATKVPYDLVIGNGTVDARQLLGATSLPAAGIPGTASNP